MNHNALFQSHEKMVLMKILDNLIEACESLKIIIDPSDYDNDLRMIKEKITDIQCYSNHITNYLIKV